MMFDNVMPESSDAPSVAAESRLSKRSRANEYLDDARKYVELLHKLKSKHNKISDLKSQTSKQEEQE